MTDLKIIQDELSNLQPGWIILLETEPNLALEVSLKALKLLTEKGYVGIIISASRPYVNLMAQYRNVKMDESKIFVLDVITKSQGGTPAESANVLYLDNVAALTEISISMKKAIELIIGNKFVFIDSINTMLIHTPPEVFLRFIHSILTKLRLEGINGFLISIVGETKDDVRAEIAQLCDKVIRVG